MYRILIEAGGRKIEFHYEDGPHLEFGLTNLGRLVAVSGIDDALDHVAKVAADMAERAAIDGTPAPIVHWPA